MARRLFLLLALFFALGSNGGSGDARPVIVLRLASSIQPGTVRYLERGLSTAEREHARLVLVELDTPGGLDVSLRRMTTAITRSPTPVAIFVTPAGARAASAGFFLLLAADVAVMAPGTNTGAAHPIAMGERGKTPDVALEKATQDAAALARALASQRGRSTEWAERAVTESRSYDADEARDRRLIDLVARDRAQLLWRIDGWTIHRFDGGAEVLRLADSPTVELQPTLAERVVIKLADPTLAYLLLMLGMLGIAVELTSPGAVVPGVIGAVSLLLSLYAFSILPVSWIGALLMLLGVGLLIAEIFVTSFGLLGMVGAAFFVVGSLLLVESPLPGMAGIGLGVVLPSAVVLAVVILGVAGRALQARRRAVRTGLEGLVGRSCEVVVPLEPDGKVFVHGEYWKAVGRRPLGQGSRARVVAVEGDRLIVDSP